MSSPKIIKTWPLTCEMPFQNEEMEYMSRLIVFGVNSIYKSYKSIRTANYWKLSIQMQNLGGTMSDVLCLSKGEPTSELYSHRYPNVIAGVDFVIDIDSAMKVHVEHILYRFIEEVVTSLASDITTFKYYMLSQQNAAQYKASQLLLSLSSLIFEEGVMDNFLSELVETLQISMDGTICSMAVVKWSKETETFEMPAVYERGRFSLGGDKFSLDVLKHRPIYRVILNEKPLIMTRKQNREVLAPVNVHSFEEAATVIFPMDLGIQKGAVSISSKVVEEFSCIDIALIASAVESLATIYRQNIIQSKMFKQANYDQLTSLANRSYFKRFLSSLELEEGETASLLYIDLDKFKEVNDGYGHDVGDRYLRVVAQRISSQLRDNDLAARIGGDEFAVVITSLNSPDDSLRVAARIVSAFERPIDIDGIDHDAGVSIGICDFQSECDVSLALIRADKAMYEAKTAGRGRYIKYTD